MATDEPIHLIVDSTGLSIVGEGEWAAAKHGGKGKRGWRKLHIGVGGSGAIVAQVLTASCPKIRLPSYCRQDARFEASEWGMRADIYPVLSINRAAEFSTSIRRFPCT